MVDLHIYYIDYLDISNDHTNILYEFVESAYQKDYNEDPDLPKIPVHPIGYDDAYHLLRCLSRNNLYKLLQKLSDR